MLRSSQPIQDLYVLQQHLKRLVLTSVVSFSTSDPSTLPALTSALVGLKDTVVTPDGRKAIKSLKGGKQTSVEGHEKGMQVVFVMEFEASQLPGRRPYERRYRGVPSRPARIRFC